MTKDFFNFILGELKPHRRIVILCVVLATVAAVLDTLGPVVMGWGIDLAAARSAPLLYGGAVLGWLVIRSISNWIRTYVENDGGTMVSNKISYSFTERACARIMDKPLEYHFGKKIQELSERVSTFRWSLGNFLEMGAFDLVPSVLALLAVTGYLFYVDWRVGTIIVASLVAYVTFSGKMTGRLVKLRDVWNNADSSFFGVIHDSLRNILLVKSTTNEMSVARRVSDRKKKIFDAAEKDVAIGKQMINGQNMIAAVAMSSSIALGASGLAAGKLTVGQVSTVLAFVFTIFGYVRFIQWQFRMYLRATADMNAIMPELDLPGEDFISGREISIRGDIEFRDVRFRYREDRPALEGVSFSVPAGTFAAIVGESGEGKTTLIDLIGRYWQPQSGSILIDGTDIREANLRSLRSQMAYVPQDLTLFHESLGDNIRFGRPDATDEEVNEAVRLAGLSELVARQPDGLDTAVGERGLKLSGGERQRVAIARAFLRDPRILILDEPTSNLDSKTEAVIHESVHKLMPGRTVFVIAHRLRTITEADMILVLSHGRIVETGSHNELSSKPGSVYVSLLKAQGMM